MTRKILAGWSSGRRQTLQILVRIDAAPMSIGPHGLNRIPAYQRPASQFKTSRGVANTRTHHIAEDIRFASAGCTRTGASQKLQRKKRLRAIVPLDGEFAANELQVLRLQAHQLLPP